MTRFMRTSLWERKSIKGGAYTAGYSSMLFKGFYRVFATISVRVMSKAASIEILEF